MDMLEQNDAIIRLSVFLTAVIVFGSLEAFFPARQRLAKRLSRWRLNGCLAILDALCLRFFMPILAIGGATVAASKGWGLFNQLNLPAWLEVTLSLVLLDLAIFGQHVASHRIPTLWRFHAVHHTDNEVDVTTGIRFHPIEAILSMAFKVTIVLALGAPVLGVLLFEIALSLSALFTHSNIRLPYLFEVVFNRVFVTPKMHRIHHSSVAQDADTNYGFFLSVWDQLFNTYADDTKSAIANYPLGLPGLKGTRPISLLESLTLPFRLHLGHQSLPTLNQSMNSEEAQSQLNRS